VKSSVLQCERITKLPASPCRQPVRRLNGANERGRAVCRAHRDRRPKQRRARQGGKSDSNIQRKTKRVHAKTREILLPIISRTRVLIGRRCGIIFSLAKISGIKGMIEAWYLSQYFQATWLLLSQNCEDCFLGSAARFVRCRGEMETKFVRLSGLWGAPASFADRQ